jgi:hypothetical protein
VRPPLVYGLFGCSLFYAPWLTLRCPVCPIWPACAIMREDPRIFYAHTLRHLLVEDVRFLFLGPLEWTFLCATWKRTSWRARRYAGCPWGRHGCAWDAIWVNKCAKKKRALFNHPCGSNEFFVVKACSSVHIRMRQSKNCEFGNKRRLVSDQFGHREFECGPQSTWKWDLDPKNSIPLWGRMFK